MAVLGFTERRSRFILCRDSPSQAQGKRLALLGSKGEDKRGPARFKPKMGR